MVSTWVLYFTHHTTAVVGLYFISCRFHWADTLNRSFLEHRLIAFIWSRLLMFIIELRKKFKWRCRGATQQNSKSWELCHSVLHKQSLISPFKTMFRNTQWYTKSKRWLIDRRTQHRLIQIDPCGRYLYIPIFEHKLQKKMMTVTTQFETVYNCFVTDLDLGLGNTQIKLQP